METDEKWIPSHQPSYSAPRKAMLGSTSPPHFPLSSLHILHPLPFKSPWMSSFDVVNSYGFYFRPTSLAEKHSSCIDLLKSEETKIQPQSCPLKSLTIHASVKQGKYILMVELRWAGTSVSHTCPRLIPVSFGWQYHSKSIG